MATEFIVVPINIMHDKNLTPNQKFILSEIKQLSTLEHGCIASNRHFAELVGIKVQGVSNAINDLAKKEYIVIDNSKTVRNYGRVITIHENVSPIHQNVSTIHENVETKGNKTTNKTINLYELFLENLTRHVKYKSKVTNTKEGAKLFKEFKGIDAVNQLIKDYTAYQNTKGEFAIRITDFMKDYEVHRSNNQTISYSAGTTSPEAMRAIEARYAK